ncbi:deacetylase [Mangrovactinospora gilvigrisea]|uniref:Deacetylase n=1 Tax=Mangrovactinospora gilvigrisea TaxID=1428644 RepID=A0A1J7BCR4_9ACTN|nr:polysaccharide deacetylase family protein [Mangrovactinospora gilvigrisea]OIV36495.1 deacetylase [Mangrovactinospora gilvigrisea]
MKRSATIRAGIAGAAAATLAVLATGCTTYDTTTPADARKATSSDAAVPAGQPDCRRLKCVALTFDAGPSANTPKLLQVLRAKHTHATFFMLGKNHVMKHPETVRAMAAGGHELANHTWSHKILTKIPEAEARREIERTEIAVQRITGTRPTLMRPPQGRTNQKVIDLCKKLGVSQVLWSVTAKDYATTDSALIRKRVLEQVKPNGIILLHDLYKGTVPAVPGILDDLHRRGYTVVTVGQLLAPAKPLPGTVYKP